MTLKPADIVFADVWTHSIRVADGATGAVSTLSGTRNVIRGVNLGQVPANAVVEGWPTITGADASFVIRRTAAGAVTVPFTVIDACGDWPTFAGGGPNAF